MRSDALGQGTATVTDSGDDPRVAGLGKAVARLRAELDGHPAQLRDRDAAVEGLDALDVQLAEGAPTVGVLRQALLLIVAAVGSVSALSDALTDLRKAIELFGEPAEFRRVN